MTTPLSELLIQVPALNTPDQPFRYTVEGDRIVASWDIVSAAYVTLASAGTIDEDYSLTVEFDERKGTYDFTEHKTSSGIEARGDGVGGFSIGGGTSSFSGKSSSKSFSFSAGGAYVQGDEVSPTLSYSFETSRIKDPLFGYIEGHGWERKKGFLGGLFGR